MKLRLPIRSALACGCTCALLAACSNLPTWVSPSTWFAGTPAKPAYLTRPVGSLCLAEIAAFATERTGRRVTLTASAFANQSDLELPLAGLPLMPSRPYDAPRSALESETFVLSQDGKACRVSHPRSRESLSLRECDCAPR